MSLKFGSETVNSVNFVDANGVTQTVNTIVFNSAVAWERPYTLTISTVNSSYIKSYSVSRTATSEPTATTGTLVNNAVIYHEDALTTAVVAADSRYSDWNPASMSNPTFGNYDSTSIVVNNTNSYAVNLSYGTTSAAGTDGGTIAANSSKTISSLSPNTTYYFKFSAGSTRTRYDRTASASPAAVDSVAGNVTITFTGVEDAGHTESRTLTATASKATRPQYTITWKYLSAYPDTWATAAQTYNYGVIPSRSNPSTVTSGNERKVFSKWDSLAAVTADRTITAEYTQQYNVTFTTTYSTPYNSAKSAVLSNGWHNSDITYYWKAAANYSFNGSSVADFSAAQTLSSSGVKILNPGYINITIACVNCTAKIDETTTTGGIYKIGKTITFTADSGYAFDTNNSQTVSFQVSLGTISYSATAKRYLKLAATAQSKQYDGTKLSADNTYSTSAGSVIPSSGHTINVTGSGSTSAVTAGSTGTKSITAVIKSGTTDVSSQYYIAYTTANLTINKRSTTITAANKSKYYGDANPAFTYTVSPALVSSGDLGTISCSTTATTASTVGTYPITVSYTANSNYAVTTVNGTLTINKATPVLTVSGTGTYTYSGSARSLTCSVSPNIAGTINYGTTTSVAESKAYSKDVAIASITNVGSITYYAKFTPTDTTNYNATAVSGAKTIVISKAAPTYTAPTLVSSALTYTGSAQYLADAGSTSHGTIYYKVDSGSYSTTRPSATAAGTYTVSWKLTGDDNHTDIAETSLGNKTINKAASTLPTTWQGASKYYDGNAATVTATGYSGGTIYYATCDTESGAYSDWTTTKPTRTAVGSTYVKCYIKGDSNHNDSAASSAVSITIYKATDARVTITLTDRTYTGSAQVIAAGSDAHGIASWYIGLGTSSTVAPTSWGAANTSLSATNAGTYYVWYKFTGDASHESKAATYVGVANIAKATPTYTAPTLITTALTYNGSAQTIVNAGSTSHGTIYYSIDGGSWSTTRTAKNAGDYSVSWKLTGDSNHTDVASTSLGNKNIAKKALTVTAPTGKLLTYSGSAQALANAGSYTGQVTGETGGTFTYKLSTASTYSSTIPTGTTIGSYTVNWLFTPGSNYSATNTSGNATATISAGKYTLTIHRQYNAITGRQSKASSATIEADVAIEVTYGQQYSYTYSKTGYDSQIVSGVWSKVGSDETTLTLDPHQYTLSKDLINWAGDWYYDSACSEGTETTWMYYGYTSYFKATPTMHYEQTIDSTRYYNGVNYTTNVTSSDGSVSLNATEITYTVTCSLSNSVVKVNTSASSYVASLSKTYAQLYTSNPSIYYEINPNSHYGMTYSSTWYYNGNPLSGSTHYAAGNTFTFNDANKTATKALSTSTYPVTTIIYTVTTSAGNSICKVGTTAGSYSANITSTYQSKTIYYQQTPLVHHDVTYSSTRYYDGSPYASSANLTSFTFSDANKTAIKTLTTASEFAYTWEVNSANSDYCYYKNSNSTSDTPTTRPTILSRYSTALVYFVYKVNPSDYYYCNSTSNPKGSPFSSYVNKSGFTFDEKEKTAVYNKNCSPFTYTCKPATVTGGTVAWSPATITCGKSSTYTITASTGYTRPTTYTEIITWENFTKSTTTASGNATSSAPQACTPNTYTVSCTSTNGVVTVSADDKTYGDTASVVYGQTVYYKINPNTYYYYSSTSYYHGNPYSSCITLNNSNFTLNGSNATKAFSACTAITYTFRITSSNAEYCYYGATAPSTGSTTAVTATYANRANAKVYYKINPSAHYDLTIGSTRYYNGNPGSSSIQSADGWTFTDSSQTASRAYNCSAISYAVSGGTSSHGTVSWTTPKTYGASSTWTISPDTGYNEPAQSTGSYAVNTTNFTISDADKTAVVVSSIAFSPCTAKTFTITLDKNGGTYDGSATATYNSDKLTSLSGATYTGHTCQGYYTAVSSGSMVASPTGYLEPSISGYTDSDGKWTKQSDTTLYARWSINTYTITWKYLSAYNTWTTVTETYDYGATPARTAPGTVTSGNERKVFSAWDDLSPVTANRTITANYTQQYNVTFAKTYATPYNSSKSATLSDGWYTSGTQYYWKAAANYSYGGSTTEDYSSIQTISSGGAKTLHPGYINCTISGTNCSADKSSSILATGTTITWTASTATNTKYSFTNSSATSPSTTTTAAVTLGTTSYSKTASYIYYNVTISGTNCTANYSSGYILNGTTITWTASTATNTKYSFTNTSATSPTTTTTATVSSAGQSLSKTASYIYYNVTISPATNCTANYSSGYILNGTQVTFTTTAATSSVRYSFSTSSSTSYNAYGTVSSAGQTISSGTVYTWGNCTVGIKYSSTVLTSQNVWARYSTTLDSATYYNQDTYDYNAQYYYTGKTTNSITVTSTTTTVYTTYSTQNTHTYQLTLSSTYGYWTKSGTTVTKTDAANYGTAVSLSGQTLTVGSTAYVFNANATTKQYNFAFSAITGKTSGTIVATDTTTGTATRSDREYTIKWIGADGSTALETDTGVKYTTALTYNSSTPTKSSTDQYTYAFSKWTKAEVGGTTVTSGTSTLSSLDWGSTTTTTLNIYSNFTATERSYDITLACAASPTAGGSVGYWKNSSGTTVTKVTAPYSATISKSGTTLTVNGNNYDYYMGSANTGYHIDASSISGKTSGTVGTGGTATGTSTYAINTYTVSFATAAEISGWPTGSWNNAASIVVDYGTSISKSNNTVTIGSTSRTYTKGTKTGYTTDYSLAWSPTGSTITASTTITGTTTYAAGNATITDGTGVSKAWVTNDSTGATRYSSGEYFPSGTVVYGIVEVSVTGSSYYPQSSWYLLDTAAPDGSSYRLYRVGTGTITDGGTVNFGKIDCRTQSSATYATLKFTKNTGISSVTTTYKDMYLRMITTTWTSSQTSGVKVLPSTTVTWSTGAATGYNVNAGSGWAAGTGSQSVSASTTYTIAPTASLKSYTVTFSAAYGSIYVTTTQGSRTGSGSGATFTHGSHLYIYVRLDTAQVYRPDANWTLGAAMAESGAKYYLVAEKTSLTSNWSAGAFDAPNSYEVMALLDITVPSGLSVTATYKDTWLEDCTTTRTSSVTNINAYKQTTVSWYTTKVSGYLPVINPNYNATGWNKPGTSASRATGTLPQSAYTATINPSTLAQMEGEAGCYISDGCIFVDNDSSFDGIASIYTTGGTLVAQKEVESVGSIWFYESDGLVAGTTYKAYLSPVADSEASGNGPWTVLFRKQHTITYPTSPGTYDHCVVYKCPYSSDPTVSTNFISQGDSISGLTVTATTGDYIYIIAGSENTPYTAPASAYPDYLHYLTVTSDVTVNSYITPGRRRLCTLVIDPEGTTGLTVTYVDASGSHTVTKTSFTTISDVYTHNSISYSATAFADGYESWNNVKTGSTSTMTDGATVTATLHGNSCRSIANLGTLTYRYTTTKSYTSGANISFTVSTGYSDLKYIYNKTSLYVNITKALVLLDGDVSIYGTTKMSLSSGQVINVSFKGREEDGLTPARAITIARYGNKTISNDGSANRAIWWRYPCTGTATERFDIQRNSVTVTQDTGGSLWTWTGSAATKKTDNDDSSIFGGNQPGFSFAMTSGITYYYQLSHYNIRTTWSPTTGTYLTTPNYTLYECTQLQKPTNVSLTLTATKTLSLTVNNPNSVAATAYISGNYTDGDGTVRSISTITKSVSAGSTATQTITTDQSIASANITVCLGGVSGTQTSAVVSTSVSATSYITMAPYNTSQLYSFSRNSRYDVSGYDAYVSTNKLQASTYSVVKLTFTGMSSCTIYIRSYAESTYDYTIASTVNASSYPTSSSVSTAKASTSGNQKSGTTLSDYTAVSYTNLVDGDYIYLVYRKDGSTNSNHDTGYFLVPALVKTDSGTKLSAPSNSHIDLSDDECGLDIYATNTNSVSVKWCYNYWYYDTSQPSAATYGPGQESSVGMVTTWPTVPTNTSTKVCGMCDSTNLPGWAIIDHCFIVAGKLASDTVEDEWM